MTQMAYKKGEVSVAPGEAQKPQGEAQRLNEQVATPSAQAALDPQTTAPDPQGMGGPAPGGPITTNKRVKPPGSLNENEQLLAGPTDRPNEPVTARPNMKGQVPDAVMEALPALLEAANDPHAPPALHALLRLVDYHVNG